MSDYHHPKVPTPEEVSARVAAVKAGWTRQQEMSRQQGPPRERPTRETFAETDDLTENKE